MKKLHCLQIWRKIESEAFAGCYSLKPYIIPESTFVATDAFPLEEYDITLLDEQPSGTYRVSFNANGGVFQYVPIMPQTVAMGTAVNMPYTSSGSGHIIKKPGYMFAGWSTDKNAEDITYKTGDSVVFNENITLYAVWKDLHEFNAIMNLKNRMFLEAVYHAFIIKPDRTVESFILGNCINFKNCKLCNIHTNSEFRDIIALESTNNPAHMVLYGLRSDGTVVTVVESNDAEAYKMSNFGQENVGWWTDIVQISASNNHVLGLRSDGKVLAAGKNDYGQCNVGEWTDIVQVAVANDVSVGLKADGTVVGVGQDQISLSMAQDENGVVHDIYKDTGIFSNMDKFSDIVKVDVVNEYDTSSIVALRDDGIFLYSGIMPYSDWMGEEFSSLLWFDVQYDRVLAVSSDYKLFGLGSSVGEASLLTMKKEGQYKDIVNFDCSGDPKHVLCAVTKDGRILTSKDTNYIYEEFEILGDGAFELNLSSKDDTV